MKKKRKVNVHVRVGARVEDPGLNSVSPSSILIIESCRIMYDSYAHSVQGTCNLVRSVCTPLNLRLRIQKVERGEQRVSSLHTF